MADDLFAPIGRLLAVATGRELRTVAFGRPLIASDGTLTIAAEQHRLSPALMTASSGPVGFFTTRDVSAGRALLLRTLLDTDLDEPLLFDPTRPHLDTDRRIHGTATSAERLVAPTPIGQRMAVAGRSHGRECFVLLGESLLCGRVDVNSEGLYETAVLPETAWAGRPVSTRASAYAATWCRTLSP